MLLKLIKNLGGIGVCLIDYLRPFLSFFNTLLFCFSNFNAYHQTIKDLIYSINIKFQNFEYNTENVN